MHLHSYTAISDRTDHEFTDDRFRSFRCVTCGKTIRRDIFAFTWLERFFIFSVMFIVTATIFLLPSD